jgi:hypothetical protein
LLDLGDTSAVRRSLPPRSGVRERHQLGVVNSVVLMTR